MQDGPQDAAAEAGSVPAADAGVSRQDTLGEALRRVSGLYLAGICFGIATGALAPLVTLTLAERGFDTVFIGSVASALYSGNLLAVLLFPAIVRALGHKPSAIVGAAIGTAATLALVLLPGALTWILGRAGTGFYAGGFYVTIDTWLGRITTASVRARVFGFSESLRMLSMAAGPLLLLVLSTEAAFVTLAVVIAVAVLPALWTQKPTQTGQPGSPLPSLRLLGRYWTLLALLGASGGLFAPFFAYSALYARQIGLGDPLEVLLATAILGTGALMQVVTAPLADRVGRSVTLAGAMAIGCGASGLLAVLGAPPAQIAFPLAAIAAAMCFPLYPIGLARFMDVARPHELVAGTSAMLFSYSLGAVIGPVLAGLAMQAFGAAGLFVYSSGLFALAGAVAVLDGNRYRDAS